MQMAIQEIEVVIPELLPPFVNYYNYTEEYEQKVGFGPGIVWQIFRQLAKQMNVTYVVKQVGYSVATRWEEAYGALRNTKAEFVVGAAVLQANSHNNTWFSHPFLFESTGVLYQISTDHVYYQNDNQITVFTVEDVVATSIVVVASMLFLMFIHGSYKTTYCTSEDKSFSSIFLVISALITGKSVECKSSSYVIRCFFISWYIFALMYFIAAIAGSFFYPNIVRYTKHTFNSFEEIVNAIETGKYTVVLHDKSARTDMIKASILHDINRLWTYIDQNQKVIYTSTIHEGVELVKQNPYYMLIGPFDTLDVISKTDCRLEMMPEGILPAFQAVALKEDSIYEDALNKIILRLIEHGFIRKWMTGFGKYLDGQKVHSKCNRKQIETLPLKMPLMINTFLLLGFGLVIASAALLIELSRNTYRLGEESVLPFKLGLFK